MSSCSKANRDELSLTPSTTVATVGQTISVTLNSNAKTDTKVLTIKGVVEASEENNEQAMPLKKSSGLPFENNK